MTNDIKHTHDQPNLPKEVVRDIMSFWKEPNIYTFDSKVKEIDNQWVRLSKTHFYPEGGGQLYDTGILQSGDHQFNVIEVQSRGGEIWHKLGKNEFSEGTVVTGTINQDRRDKLTRSHSGQHLLSAVLWEDYEIDTISASLGPEISNIELDKNIGIDLLESTLEVTNQMVLDDLPIYSKYLQEMDLKKFNFRGKIGKQSIYRLVQIGEYDFNLCGGTHLQSTIHIGFLAVSKIESKKIYFMTGAESVKRINQSIFDQYRIARILGTKHREIVKRVDDLLAQKIRQEKIISKSMQQVVELQLTGLGFAEVGEFKLKFAQVFKVETPVILNSIGELASNEVVFVYDDDTMFFLYGGDSSIINNLKTQFATLGLKGGGKGSLMIGKFGQIKTTKILNMIKSVLVNNQRSKVG